MTREQAKWTVYGVLGALGLLYFVLAYYGIVSF